MKKNCNQIKLGGPTQPLVLFPSDPFIQIDLMISGNEPVKAMTYLRDLALFFVVFNIPSPHEPSISEECHRYMIGSITSYTAKFGLLPALFLFDKENAIYLQSTKEVQTNVTKSLQV